MGSQTGPGAASETLYDLEAAEVVQSFDLTPDDFRCLVINLVI